LSAVIVPYSIITNSYQNNLTTNFIRHLASTFTNLLVAIATAVFRATSIFEQVFIILSKNSLRNLSHQE